jgi:Mycothiol maleylpyruvate isomerase N-terminal domain
MALDRSYVAENRGQLERLRGLVDKLGDRELAGPMEAGWTVAAVLAHLAFWDQRTVVLLDRWDGGRGTPPPAYDEGGVDWINDAGKPLCLALPPRVAARLAIDAAIAADERVANLSEAQLQAIGAGNHPINPRRAEHRREHLDEIEAALSRR